jgi:hypothetical protein
MNEFEEIVERNYTVSEMATLTMKAMTYESWKAMMEGRDDN